ncbi:GFA family protein [Paracoccus aminophilus]|uniref:Glutathione-dependent formaldehyde-activating GFA n=1 Tax=Paracoccus aminophilus JCM 7686 TaxID=1367847 RepID=S5XQH5_PARAH|nr:GFA family protein [Paracoccus aminophilus]AGT09624.1 glutathione-dependent formaldehyde-activating GFA [Paracoccus aminophilus JCM 7686]
MTLDLDLTESTGACHCGAVRFHVRLSEGLRSARRCNCSFCQMRGAIAVSARVGELEILQGADALTLYQFGTSTAKHYFCRHCGIYTHHQRRSNPQEYGVNIACLTGLSPFDFTEVEVLNGREHPSDKANGREVVGVLRFEPS